MVLKVCREFDDATSAGKLFHVRAAATGNDAVDGNREAEKQKVYEGYRPAFERSLKVIAVFVFVPHWPAKTAIQKKKEKGR